MLKSPLIFEHFDAAKLYTKRMLLFMSNIFVFVSFSYILECCSKILSLAY